jgi:hypothetical protein
VCSKSDVRPLISDPAFGGGVMVSVYAASRLV